MIFLDCLDEIGVLSSDAVEGEGEDSHYIGNTDQSALIGVFDGSGGLGSRRYDSYGKRKGAFMASHVLSSGLKAWYQSKEWESCQNDTKIAESMNRYFLNNLKLCEKHASGYLKLKGSMVRDFPSTASIAFLVRDNQDLKLFVIWAGDSRVYILGKNGLKQLSEDDADGDAFESLLNSGAMSNVLSSDGDYVLHSKAFSVTEPVMIISASDGAYGYVNTPMDFEYLIVKTICQSETPSEFRAGLFNELKERAGDDVTFAYMNIGFGSYKGLRSYFAKRKKELEDKYITKLDANRGNLSISASLWEIYKNGYEEFLNNRREA